MIHHERKAAACSAIERALSGMYALDARTDAVGDIEAALTDALSTVAWFRVRTVEETPGAAPMPASSRKRGK